MGKMLLNFLLLDLFFKKVAAACNVKGWHILKRGQYVYKFSEMSIYNNGWKLADGQLLF